MAVTQQLSVVVLFNLVFYYQFSSQPERDDLTTDAALARNVASRNGQLVLILDVLLLLLGAVRAQTNSGTRPMDLSKAAAWFVLRAGSYGRCARWPG